MLSLIQTNKSIKTSNDSSFPRWKWRHTQSSIISVRHYISRDHPASVRSHDSFPIMAKRMASARFNYLATLFWWKLLELGFKAVCGVLRQAHKVNYKRRYIFFFNQRLNHTKPFYDAVSAMNGEHTNFITHKGKCLRSLQKVNNKRMVSTFSPSAAKSHETISKTMMQKMKHMWIWFTTRLMTKHDSYRKLATTPVN